MTAPPPSSPDVLPVSPIVNSRRLGEDGGGGRARGGRREGDGDGEGEGSGGVGDESGGAQMEARVSVRGGGAGAAEPAAGGSGAAADAEEGPGLPAPPASNRTVHLPARAPPPLDTTTTTAAGAKPPPHRWSAPGARGGTPEPDSPSMTVDSPVYRRRLKKTPSGRVHDTIADNKMGFRRFITISCPEADAHTAQVLADLAAEIF